MSEITVRRAEETDLRALAMLRSDWTREWGGVGDDPGFTGRFAAWFEQEAERRVSWLAEDGGRAIGMVNLAVFERMPQPGRRRAGGDTWPTRSCSPRTATGVSVADCWTRC